jgi:hypothetical protein
MNSIADYPGALLSHLETLYRPGERDLATDLVEALGCTVADTGFKGDGVDTFLAVHPNPEDRDPQKNVFYMSQVRPEQLLVEERLKEFSNADVEFAALLEGYRQAARTKPFGVPHFALRYTSRQEIEAVATRIESLSNKNLKHRIHLRIFYPGDEDVAVGTLIQGFIYQDIVVSGSFLMGQIIELQARP